MQQGLLPLFPLEVVLMPGAHLPLHIFEERYKEMIGEALRDKKEFGVVLATGQGLAEIGCTATIEGVLKQYPDGRLDIITVGRRRFEILLVNEERDFLRGAVEFFDDEPEADSAPPDARQAAINAYNALQVVWKNAPLEESGLTDPRVSFRLVRAIKDLQFRQSMLASRSEDERIRKLAAYLPGYVQHIAREQAIKDAAPRNGHVHHNGNGSKTR
jgi:Lon protease-like protein